jgi:hypothetical protein
VRDARNKDVVNGYARQIVPWDIGFLLFLGGFLAMGSASLASNVVLTSQLPFWLYLIIPGTYVCADIIEDMMIVFLLTSPQSIGRWTFLFYRFAMRVKTVTVVFAFGQLLLISALAIVQLTFA